MPDLSSKTPSYRKHKASGRACVTLSGRTFYLGKYGSDESRQKYDRLVAEWLANGRRWPTAAPKDVPLSVNELLLAYMEYAEPRYRLNKAGRLDRTGLPHIRAALRPIRELYGLTPACEFGPLALDVVRRQYIAAGWSRGYVNGQIQRVRQVFKWAVARQLVPPSVWHGLQAVEALRQGESGAPEPKVVRPVPDVYVDATLPHVAPEVGAMIELQRITGMRSGEVTIMRTGDIDMSGAVWSYRPAEHKTEHHGHERVVWIGPKAQDILRPWLQTNLTAYVFSPARARERRYASMREDRKTHVQPSQIDRRKRRPKRLPGERWTSDSYHRAIVSGIRKANVERRQCGETEIPHWHPHQLRHNAATAIRKAASLDAARAALGQKSLAVAEIYAEQDAAVARDAALQVG
ncbi:MAG: site-specific integrase [Planctomycetota bacterium]